MDYVKFTLSLITTLLDMQEHDEVKTTESYLDSFENEMKKEFSTSLLAFKKAI